MRPEILTTGYLFGIFITVCMMHASCSWANESRDSEYLDPGVLWSENSYYKLLKKDLLYLLDEEHQQTLDSIEQYPRHHFKPVQHSEYGVGERTIWFYLKVSNIQPSKSVVYLSVANPQLDEVAFLVIGTQFRQQYFLGDTNPMNNRPIDSQFHVIPLQLSAYEEKEIFIKVVDSGVINVPVELWEPNAFYRRAENSIFIFGIFLGFLIVIAILNLLFYLMTANFGYITFAFYSLALILLYVTYLGYGHHNFWPYWESLNNNIIRIFLGIYVFSRCLLVSSILNLKDRSPVADKAFGIIAKIALFNAALYFMTPYHISILINIVCGLACQCLSFILSVVYYKRYSRQSRFFLYAGITDFIVILIFIGGIVGLQISGDDTVYKIALLNFFHCIFCALALGDRMKFENSKC